VRRKQHDKWQGQWFLHNDNSPSYISIVMQQFLAGKTLLSSPNHRTLQMLLGMLLAVPYSENGPQGDSFCKHEGHQIECNCYIPKDSIRSLPLVLPIMAGLIEQVCVCVCVCKGLTSFRELFDYPSHFWCGAPSPCRVLRMFSFLWFCMPDACIILSHNHKYTMHFQSRMLMVSVWGPWTVANGAGSLAV
jgi:hypothetical protein